MIKKQFNLTEEGIVQLREELELLISQRPEVSERIKTAREFGDLAENAEYSAARQEQEKAESRISEIQHVLENVKVIEQPKNKDIVELGNEVELKAAKVSKVFTIVGSIEANPAEAKISDESPIGKALLGKKLGENVDIVTPSATTTYKITKIS
jgi:transcription elongation factor GreA